MLGFFSFHHFRLYLSYCPCHTAYLFYSLLKKSYSQEPELQSRLLQCLSCVLLRRLARSTRLAIASGMFWPSFLLSSFRHDPNRPDSLSSDEVRSVLFDSSGTLWVGTIGGGLNRFDDKTGGF